MSLSVCQNNIKTQLFTTAIFRGGFRQYQEVPPKSLELSSKSLNLTDQIIIHLETQKCMSLAAHFLQL